MSNKDDLGPQRTGLPLTLSLRILQQSTQREKMSVAAVTIRIHYPRMVTMLRADTPDMGDGHATTEAKLLRRFRQLITYCLGRFRQLITYCLGGSPPIHCRAFLTAWTWE